MSTTGDNGLHSDKWAHEAADLLVLAMNGNIFTSLTATTGPRNESICRSVKESGEIFQRLRTSCHGNEHTCAVIAAAIVTCIAVGQKPLDNHMCFSSFQF